jgi:putative transcriptional regulator
MPMSPILRWFALCLILTPLLIGARVHAQLPVRSDAVLLVASPTLQDPNFSQSVVLVMFPAEGGPTGVILNRPTPLAFSEVFPDDPALRTRTEPIFFGGPVRMQALWYLFRRLDGRTNALPVVDDLCLSADGDLLDELIAKQRRVERFFVGYAGWGPTQLDFEIAQGAWYVLPADLDSILNLDPKTMWRELLERATAVRT